MTRRLLFLGLLTCGGCSAFGPADCPSPDNALEATLGSRALADACTYAVETDYEILRFRTGSGADSRQAVRGLVIQTTEPRFETRFSEATGVTGQEGLNITIPDPAPGRTYAITGGEPDDEDSVPPELSVASVVFRNEAGGLVPARDGEGTLVLETYTASSATGRLTARLQDSDLTATFTVTY